MKEIVPVLTLLDREVRESFLKAVGEPDDEILTDTFEEILTNTFLDLKIGDFLKKTRPYKSWEDFVKIFLQTFTPSKEPRLVKTQTKKKGEPSPITVINIPEDSSKEVLEVLNNKGLSAKEKIFQLKTLSLSRAKVIELNFCHWTYVYELWRI